MTYLDFKSIEENDKAVILRKVKNFELNNVFECGQCFRWYREDNGNYICIAYDRVIELEKNEEDLIIYNTNIDDFNNIWLQYFDLERDYGAIKEQLSKDSILKQAVEFGHGIRLLRQEPFEMTLSFIISSNNRIPMIKRAIENISKTFGNPIIYKNKTYYSFPKIEQLEHVSIEDLQGCGTGFRAKYLKDTIQKICSGESDLNYIKNLNDDSCHEELKKFSGIGPKVSDCIMLFSMQKYSAFPVDVWVKRAMQYFYVAPDVSLPKIRIFARDKFENLAGFAQQYLFYYARENNINIENRLT